MSSCFVLTVLDSLKEGYLQLRALVMAYGDISPESPLSLSSSSHRSSSAMTTPTTEHPTPHPPHTPGSTHSPSLLELNNVRLGILETSGGMAAVIPLVYTIKSLFISHFILSLYIRTIEAQNILLRNFIVVLLD